MSDPTITNEPHRTSGEARRPRGRHKVFLGMAAGVGKTYRMLQEAQAEAEAGRDVVIGYLEPHRRPETSAQARDLEVIPRRRVEYREVELEEMDLPAILRRRPELCLIDELAHTNAHGVEHAKRYEDVQSALEAGIDVYSTVNVQHLESLNDQVADLTGTRVRETLPDSVLGDADEVMLVDLTPQALIARLRAGKVYPGERVEAALNNFFKVENLAALREVALRQVAEDVEAKRLVLDLALGRDDGDRMLESVAPQAIGERLLALVKPTSKSQRVVRRAWRSAQRLQGELDILWVTNREPTDEERDQLEALRRLAAVLGAHLLVEHGDDVATVVRQVAAERGTTYVLMGTPGPRNALRRLAGPALPFRLMQLLPGVDLRIVADRTLRSSEEDQ
ncbi:MAG: two-component system, OmpR family, sensor histidine kinase KdpD [Solirubrobacteraceae bacterium]|jgi:two-component system sensor histidine kinase KdpD|nr:two-component system, OmpR family, sensor histidine kinase KdpD [Solirubrobacteraceae bacterium]